MNVWLGGTWRHVLVSGPTDWVRSCFPLIKYVVSMTRAVFLGGISKNISFVLLLRCSYLH